MIRKFFIKPAPGRKVRDPQSGEHLSEAGEEKPRTSYWLRRIKDGDVQEAAKPKAATPAATKE